MAVRLFGFGAAEGSVTRLIYRTVPIASTGSDRISLFLLRPCSTNIPWMCRGWQTDKQGPGRPSIPIVNVPLRHGGGDVLVRSLGLWKGDMVENRPMSDLVDTDQPAQPQRRRALRLGAVGAVAVVSIRPAMAQAYGSVLTCEIPVPDPRGAGGYIDKDGKVVPARTKGAYAPPSRPLKGEDVRRALASGSNLPGVDYDRSRAYLKYVQNLRSGSTGFTCFASLQMPRK